MAEQVRIATFHTELSRDGPGLLLRDTLSKDDPQVEAVIQIIRASNADVLVLADIDYDLNSTALAALARRIGGYPHHFAFLPNRGVPSGVDLDGNGRIGGPGDAQGYAAYKGQGGLAVLSRWPIRHALARDFSAMRWTDLPGHIAPEGTPDVQRLSTTGHWDLPVEVTGGHLIHLLVWHATPPVFDGPEDRNGRRNHDEAAIWLRYLEDGLGLSPPSTFVIAGFANLDPVDGNGRPEALQTLLRHPLIYDPKPTSEGAPQATTEDGGINVRHLGDPSLDTVDWGDANNRPGNLRVDYVLPSRTLDVLDSGVFWPPVDHLFGRDVQVASRHRLVWVDVTLPDSARDGGQRIGHAEARQ